LSSIPILRGAAGTITNGSRCFFFVSYSALRISAAAASAFSFSS